MRRIEREHLVHGDIGIFDSPDRTFDPPIGAGQAGRRIRPGSRGTLVVLIARLCKHLAVVRFPEPDLSGSPALGPPRRTSAR
jgi:hypothetical protein